MPKTFLILSQVYVPDPASVGQHLHDVAAEMVKAGAPRHRLRQRTRATRTPRPSTPAARRRDGVEIRRIPLASFGKRSITASHRRHGVSFMGQVMTRALACEKPDAMLVSTSPPMIGGVGPDREAAPRRADDVLGDGPQPRPAHRPRQDRGGRSKGAISWRRTTGRSSTASDLVVALDRFMADRLRPRTAEARRSAPDDPAVAPRVTRRAGRARGQPVSSRARARRQVRRDVQRQPLAEQPARRRSWNAAERLAWG